MEGFRDWLIDHLGVPLQHRGRPEGQEMYLGIISLLLKELGDPDWAYPMSCSDGVPLGVDMEMPRTPAVFDEKTKWKFDHLDGEPDRAVLSYTSTLCFEEKIEALFREEEKLGWMVEMRDEDAEKKYGKNLHLAGLGVVEEKEKIRVVHDGTNGVGVNNRIRVFDQVKSPYCRGDKGPDAGEVRKTLWPKTVPPHGRCEQSP